MMLQSSDILQCELVSVDKFGPEKASTLNTYAVMKSGFKNVDSTGRSAPIRSDKAQQRSVRLSFLALCKLNSFNSYAKHSSILF
jgi:hypothetical protein